MPRYVIERRMPGAGQLSDVELRTIARQSVSVVAELGRGLVWRETYVADDKVYCVYDADDASAIHEHARCMGLPATSVVEVRATIGPGTAAAAEG